MLPWAKYKVFSYKYWLNFFDSRSWLTVISDEKRPIRGQNGGQNSWSRLANSTAKVYHVELKWTLNYISITTFISLILQTNEALKKVKGMLDAQPDSVNIMIDVLFFFIKQIHNVHD